MIVVAPVAVQDARRVVTVGAGARYAAIYRVPCGDVVRAALGEFDVWAGAAFLPPWIFAVGFPRLHYTPITRGDLWGVRHSPVYGVPGVGLARGKGRER